MVKKMKLPFDTLITDREPFFFIERATISVKMGSLVAKNKDSTFNIPASSIHCLMLGNGTSVTAEAAALCAKHNCYIAFVKGGLNAHSIWHCGRYQNPENLVIQVKKHANFEERLRISKDLIRIRLSYIKEPFVSEIDMSSIDNASSIEQLLGIEGSITRKTYQGLNLRNEYSFKRDSKSREGINSSLTLANNALYNYITTLLLPLGLSPSLGFLHGQTRRGGLVFDIADVFKYPIFMQEVFSGQYIDNAAALMRNMSKKVRDRRNYWTKEIISLVDEILCS